MIKNFQQLIILFPLLILGLTIVILILTTSFNFKKKIYSYIITIISLNISILSLFFIKKNNIFYHNFLIIMDNYSIFYIFLILISSLITSIISFLYLKKYTSYYDEFYILLLISTIGAIFLSISNNFISFFIGLKIISIPIFGMMNYIFKKKNSLNTSIKYIILSTISSSLILFGIALIYSKTGNLSFEEIKNILFIYDINHNKIFLMGIGMIISGISFYLSLVPFHYWTIDVYKNSPTSLIIFISTVSKIAIFSVATRIFYLINNTSIKIIFSLFAILSIILGNLLAYKQKNIKKMLGYSSISHMGYIIINFITINNDLISIESINLCIFSYIISNLILFSIITIISNYYNIKNKNKMSFYKGLFWKQPILAISFSIALFSLSSFPLTIGFISKFYILFLCIKNKLWYIIFSIFLGHIIGISYYLRIIINIYYPINNNLLKKINKNKYCKFNEILIFIISLFILIFGLYPQPLINISKYSIFY
ncbi:NADH-quinone oxidoreductase subunit N [Sodalis-like secondary symbiont of Drepanosiphum platanoidis]|uniref:NADH-quinone oxidoreductase subunit N n=1 Tax=Sodalis-like secondary symbiont of Drepanosiphum platanoidis TaxID=2994493 RepID=UPI003464D3DC